MNWKLLFLTEQERQVINGTRIQQTQIQVELQLQEKQIIRIRLICLLLLVTFITTQKYLSMVMDVIVQSAMCFKST